MVRDRDDLYKGNPDYLIGQRAIARECFLSRATFQRYLKRSSIKFRKCGVGIHAPMAIHKNHVDALRKRLNALVKHPKKLERHW